jgi:GMP reductase
MNIDNEIKLDFCDVLIKPKRSKAPSRSQINLIRKYKFLNSGVEVSSTPIICSNMDTVGTIAMSRAMAAHDMWGCLHKHYPSDYILNCLSATKNTFFSTGVTPDDFVKLEKLKEGLSEISPLYICIDVANGYTEFFQERAKRIREMFPNAVIMAGNVATPEMVQELLISGVADIVKVGIGPGSQCTTRLVTGVGYPQLSAIIECAESAHGLGGHICADGGCLQPGDVAKAFGAGADFVMLGGMLAGCDECEGDWEYGPKDSDCTEYVRKNLKFYGMSSKEAMNKYSGGVADYKAAEGRCTIVPYKGPASEVLKQITGGLRSACSYVGAMSLKDMSKCTTFIRVNRVHNNVL